MRQIEKVVYGILGFCVAFVLTTLVLAALITYGVVSP